MTLTRAQFYDRYRHSLSWYDADEYACFDVLPVPPEQIRAIRQTAENVWRVLVQAGEIIKTFDNETVIQNCNRCRSREF